MCLRYGFKVKGKDSFNLYLFADRLNAIFACQFSEGEINFLEMT
jgi:hypothetical protein